MFKDDLTRAAAKYGMDGRAEIINSVAVRVYFRDTNGDVLFCTGVTVPTATSAGYAKGCLFIDTDVAGGTGGLYCNKGTNLSCTFGLVTQA